MSAAVAPRPPSSAGPALVGVPAAGPERRALSDFGVVALAGATWLGAAWAHPFPLLAGVALAGVALVWRRPMLLVLAALLLGSIMGARALGGLKPVRARPFAGTVTLLSDPVDRLGSTVADVRVGQRRVELRASERGRGALAGRLAGERVRVVGRLRPPPPDSSWLVPRHVTGRLDVTAVDAAGAGSAPWRAANVVRRTLVRGADSLAPDRRSLFTGFVLGDDRAQPATVADDFRGSGLTHLLAVSGENVAFVLTLVGPLLRRLRLGPRWLVTIGVIAGFALVTRFEPSVLRAGVMAALAATAFAIGRPASGLRLLALAVAGLVLVDPLLCRAVGFRLSVAASAGILVLGPAIRRTIGGPRWLVDPFAVTAGAQLAVAPLLVTTFGGVPVASLPANLLAGPMAGLVMTWGLGAGLVAGLVGGGVAAILHVPTSLGIGWIATVARVGSTVPLGELHLAHVVGLGLTAAVAWLARRFDWRATRVAAGAVAVGVLLVPAVALRSVPPLRVVVPGGEVWRAGGATVLVSGAQPRATDLLEALRRAGLRRIDLLVVTAGPASAPAVVQAVAHRWPPATIWAGTEIRRAGPDARAPPAGKRLAIGGLVATVERDRPGLAVTVAPLGEPP